MKNKVYQKSYMKVGVKKLLITGMVPARAWERMQWRRLLTERFKFRRQMAAATGKKRTTLLSLFMEAFELSTIATQTWAGKWCTERKEAQVRQIFEVQTWRQVRDPAGAAMCETRDLSITWPKWHF